MKISHRIFVKYISNFVIFAMILVLGVVTYQGGTAKVFSSQTAEIYYCGNPKNNIASLMFNVYMGNEYVEEIINVLSEKNVKATFFVGGIWVNKNEECFMKIYNSGNEIASHGYWHKDHSNISDDEQINEIVMTDELVNKLTGIKMGLFAPPSGAYNKQTAIIAKNLNYKTILWSKDTIDWRDQDVNLITTRATNNVKAGDFILMHPTNSTAKALPKIIDIILSKGLNISTVSECLA